MLRTPSRPWGLSVVSEHAKRKIKQANVRPLASVIVAAATEENGGDWATIAGRCEGGTAVHVSQLEEVRELTHASGETSPMGRG